MAHVTLISRQMTSLHDASGEVVLEPSRPVRVAEERLEGLLAAGRGHGQGLVDAKILRIERAAAEAEAPLETIEAEAAEAEAPLETIEAEAAEAPEGSAEGSAEADPVSVTVDGAAPAHAPRRRR